MKKVILMAGYPATGKTYMSNLIKDQYQDAMYLSQDTVKEMLYDMIGFNNLREKEQVIDMARKIFYDIVMKSVEMNQIVILDYPFSDKQMNFLKQLEAKYNADFLTIRLTGDLDVLYDRRVERDVVATRNKGHILNSYHGYESYTRENYPLGRDEYKANCKKGKYNQFQFNTLIEIDVTDFEAVDYGEMNRELKEFIEGECNVNY